jgi:hypothetical protein
MVLWLARPDGHEVAKASVAVNFTAGVPAPVTMTLNVPDAAAPGTYVISAGAYDKTTPMRPYVGNFASVQVR